MIEAYAFLVMFTVQILALSVLLPGRFIHYLRLQAASFPDERLALLYPGVDFGPARERTLTGYRALNTGIAVLGLFLLGWRSRTYGTRTRMTISASLRSWSPRISWCSSCRPGGWRGISCDS